MPGKFQTSEHQTTQVVELRAKLDSAADQIKDLKDAQLRQIEMVEAVARQRDMYRVLLAQAGHTMGKYLVLTDYQNGKHVHLSHENNFK